MKWLAKFVLMLCPLTAAAQPVIDGDVDDIYYQIIGLVNSNTLAISNTGFGTTNTLGTIKYFSSTTTLYIGITGTIDNTNNIVLFIDNQQYNGRGTAKLGANMSGVFNTCFRTTGASCPAPEPNGLAGAIMDTDFDADFAFAFNKANTSTDFYMDAVRYSHFVNDGSTPAYLAGPVNVGMTDQSGTAQEFAINIPNWNTGTSKIRFAYRNGYDRLADPTKGVEIAIPLAALPGFLPTHKARFFVLITNQEGYASNVCIPGDPNTIGDAGPATNLGCGFNLAPIVNSGKDVFYTEPWVNLPLSFIHTSVQHAGSAAKLEWMVVEDNTVSAFAVERSADGIAFAEIGRVTATHRRDMGRYTYTDENPLNGKNLYRIRAVGAGGATKLSQVVALTSASVRGLRTYPNPASSQLSVQMNGMAAGPADMQLLDPLGRVCYRQSLVHDGMDKTLSFALPVLQKGIYLLKLATAGGAYASKVVVE